MDQAHIHLLIVHLPLFGAFFGMLVLAHGLWHKSEQTSIAAFNVFIISAIGAAIAKFTGEGAEEAVEHIPGVLESARRCRFLGVRVDACAGYCFDSGSLSHED